MSVSFSTTKYFEEPMVKVTPLLLILCAFLTLTPLALGQSLYDSPHIEARLWCPADIESLYLELSSNEAGNSMEKSEDPDSEKMRRVAYHILKNWPEARTGVQQVLSGWSQPGEAIHGRDLLEAVWRQWKRERKNLLRWLFAVTDKSTQNYAMSRFELKWGSDPGPVPNPVPDSWLPEECDCTWYLSVYLETSDLKYMAAYEHKGHLIQDWDASNTAVISHLASKQESLHAPYPTDITFLIRKGDTRIQLTDYIYLTRKEGWKFIRMEPRPYRDRQGVPPRVTFDVEYPIWDGANNIWLVAQGVLASSPGPEFMNVFEELKSLKKQGLKIGEDFRAWAGPYKSEDKK